MEYLGFWVTHECIKSINENIEDITNMKPPTFLKELRKFIGVLNYNCGMCPMRSDTLAPLTILTPIKQKFK